MKPPLFSSSRLVFRRWKDSDLPIFAEMNHDLEVMEFFPHYLTHEQSANVIEGFKKHFDTYGFCFYAVDLKESGEFIGFIGLNVPTFEAEFTPCVEVGWRLKKSVWNQGLASEGGATCIQYAWDYLNLTGIHSFTASLNKRSERIMQKIGMKKVSTFDHPLVEDGHRLKPHVLYRIDKE